jgi:hypothetical protein
MKPKKKNYTVYFASEFVGLDHLIGNAYLAEAIYEKSHGRYLCVLPQNRDQRRTDLHSVRDAEIHALLDCDLGLFSCGGKRFDSETAVKFMFAKFADIPSVILRCDSRQSGDQENVPRDLATNFYPRTADVVLSSIGLYKAAIQSRVRTTVRRNKLNEIVRLAGQHSSADAQTMCERIAEACVLAFDRVMRIEPIMPKYLREEVYQWLALMPNFKGKSKDLRHKLEGILEHKVEHDLL